MSRVKKQEREITVDVKDHYGNRTIYPVSPAAKLICKLIGQKTLTQEDVEGLKEIGLRIIRRAMEEDL